MSLQAIAMNHNFALARKAQEPINLESALNPSTPSSQKPQSFIMNGKSFVRNKSNCIVRYEEYGRKPVIEQSTKNINYTSNLTDALCFFIKFDVASSGRAKSEVRAGIAFNTDKLLRSRFYKDRSLGGIWDIAKDDYNKIANVANAVANMHRNALTQLTQLTTSDLIKGKPLFRMDKEFLSLSDYINAVKFATSSRTKMRTTFSIPKDNVSPFTSELEAIMKKYNVELIK